MATSLLITIPDAQCNSFIKLIIGPGSIDNAVLLKVKCVIKANLMKKSVDLILRSHFPLIS